MITRLVKLTFREEHAEEFSTYFSSIHHKIEAQKGCVKVELYSYPDQTGVFFTISTWESEEDIQNYRKSELFGQVWPKVKQWMNDRPEAWSLNQLNNKA